MQNILKQTLGYGYQVFRQASKMVGMIIINDHEIRYRSVFMPTYHYHCGQARQASKTPNYGGHNIINIKLGIKCLCLPTILVKLKCILKCAIGI